MTPEERAERLARELTQGGWTGNLDGTYQAIAAQIREAVAEELRGLKEWVDMELRCTPPFDGSHRHYRQMRYEIDRRLKEKP